MTTAVAAPPLAFVLLFVDAPLVSAEFYAALLGAPPIEASPTFAMLPFSNGVMLGLWSRHTAAPAVSAAPGASEICFVTPDVDATHADWAARGITIAQPPVDLDFGRTFVALDPDGHRIRVFLPTPDGA
jgi:predicted enzyme related to lactoylglutathione lyase